MAKKADLQAKIAGSDAIIKGIARAQGARKQPDKATEQEKAERIAAGKTQGKKGCYMPRINMAFTSENHSFIKIMSRIRGESMTDFCNYCIAQYRAEHPELYERALEIIEES